MNYYVMHVFIRTNRTKKVFPFGLSKTKSKIGTEIAAFGMIKIFYISRV